MGITAWTVKAAVQTALATALVPGVADIVQLGRPVEVPPSNKPRRVYIGDVTNDTPQPVWEPGSQIRTETYEIPLLIDCVSYTGNQLNGYATAEALVQAIVSAIENQLDADPSWGATVHESGLALSAESTGAIADQPGGSGFRSGAILELHVLRRGA